MGRYVLCLGCGVAAYCPDLERCGRCGYRGRVLSFSQLISVLVFAFVAVLGAAGWVFAR